MESTTTVMVKPQLLCTEREEFQEIKPVKNTRFIKPVGGLWTSTYTPEEEYPSAWVEWCVREEPEWIKDVNFFLLVPERISKYMSLTAMKTLNGYTASLESVAK